MFRPASPAAEETAEAVWAGIANMCPIRTEPEVPRPPTWEDHIRNAKDMRASIKRQCEREVCAVCSMIKPVHNMTRFDDIEEIPNIELLDADIEPTEECPRAGLTTFQYCDSIKYCLQPDACHHHADKVEVDVCEDCVRQLDGNRVPTESLVRFDTGEFGSLNQARRYIPGS